MDLLAFSISLGNDVLGGGKAAEAISWTNLGEKLLKIVTSPTGAGGMGLMLLSAILAGIMAWKHSDSDDKFDALNPKGIAMSVVDVGLFAVGVKLLFF